MTLYDTVTYHAELLTAMTGQIQLLSEWIAKNIFDVMSVDVVFISKMT